MARTSHLRARIFIVDFREGKFWVGVHVDFRLSQGLEERNDRLKGQARSSRQVARLGVRR
jgi:hypothetical protein